MVFAECTIAHSASFKHFTDIASNQLLKENLGNFIFIRWVSPDGAVIILTVKKDEADHEHVDGEVGEDVPLVAVHQLQQLAPGLVRARQVLQHRLTCHPFNIAVPVLIRHQCKFLANSSCIPARQWCYMMIILSGTSHFSPKSQVKMGFFLLRAFTIKEASHKWFLSSASLKWFISTFRTVGREILLLNSCKFAWVQRRRWITFHLSKIWH